MFRDYLHDVFFGSFLRFRLSFHQFMLNAISPTLNGGTIGDRVGLNSLPFKIEGSQDRLLFGCIVCRH